jgi:hypothetical protein
MIRSWGDGYIGYLEGADFSPYSARVPKIAEIRLNWLKGA